MCTIGNEMKLEVECYSGGKADERPVRFRLNGREYVVEDVLDQWYGPQDVFFKLRADDGNFYIYDSKRRLLICRGIWCHSGDYRKIDDEENGMAPV